MLITFSALICNKISIDLLFHLVLLFTMVKNWGHGYDNTKIQPFCAPPYNAIISYFRVYKIVVNFQKNKII